MINFLHLLNRSELPLKGLKLSLGLAVLMLMSLAGQVQAAHIMGGEMTYRYIGVTSGNALQYSVTVNIYADRSQGGWALNNPNDPASGAQDVRINLAAYSADDNSRLYNSTFLSPGLNQPATQRAPIFFAKPELPAACGAITCLDNYVITRSSLTVILTLPFTFNGYNVIYQDIARNNAITNISNPGSRGLSLYTGIPGPNYQNSSPQFTDNAVPVLFTNDTTFFVNTAFDPDGDRLVYSFTSALNGGGNNPPTWTVPANIPYAATFSFNDPLGPNGTSTIDPSTGITKHFCTQTGQYVVAVAIQEWRRLPNGTEIQIGTTRRELQLLVARQGNLPGDCPPNQGPQQIGSFPTNIVIQQGQSTTFNVEYRDPESNNVTLTGSSIILQGGQGYTGPLAAFNPLQGSTARGTFTWNTNCNVPPNTYSVVIKAEDAGCPPKSISQVVNITVTKATGPSLINGQNNPCVSGSIPYWVNQNLTGFTRQWKVQGGTIVRTSANSDSVRVNWTSSTGFVRVISTTPAGCRDSVTLNVNPVSVTAVNAGNNVTICQGGSTTLTATGGNNTFTWRTLAGTLVGNTASVTVSPTTTTQYVVSSTSGACAVTDTVQVSVVANPLSPVAAVSTCSSFSGAVYNNNAIAGYTYQWTVAGNNPAVSFLDPTNVRNPRVVINTVGTYRLRVTATASPSGCLFRDSVSIEVRQGPTAPTPLTYTACSGQNVVLNPNVTTPGFTYLWGSTQGFVSGNASSPSPTVNLTNTGTQPLVVRYPLSSTSFGCTRVDTLFVTVQPSTSGTFTAQACFNTAISIGPDTPVGVSYSWSPATFLSATNVAQPTFRRTGGSSTNQTNVYTLTITSANGCVNTQTWTVTSLATPTIATPSSRITVCSGINTRIGAAQADTAGQAASWLPTTGLNSATVFRPTFRLTNTGSTAQTLVYVRTIRNTTTNCTASDTVRITLQPAVVANAGRDVTICSNGFDQLGAPASAGFTYSWSPATGLSSATAANPTVNLSNAGTTPIRATYILTTTNTTTNCVGTDTVVVTVNPRAAGTNTRDSICSGAVKVFGSAQQANTTYAWTPAAQFVDATVAQAQLVNPVNTGTTPIIINALRTATNTTNGCVSTDTITISINPLPTVSAGGNVELCSETSTTVGEVAQPGFTYVWGILGNTSTTFVQVANAGQSQTLITGTNTGTINETVVLVLTKTNTRTGCAKTDTINVLVKPLPIAIAAATDTVTICTNGFAQLGAASVPNLTYQWTPATGLSGASAANPTVSLVNAGTTATFARYILLVTNTTTGCTDRDTVVVRVNPRAPGLNVRDSICSGTVRTFGTPAQPDFTYSWTPATLFVTANTAEVQLLNPTHAGPAPLVLVAQRVVTNTLNGCSTTDTFTIRINPLPTVSAGIDRTLCSGATATVGETNQAGFSYDWTILGNTASAFVTLSDTAVSNPVVTATNTGTSSVGVTLVVVMTNNVTGCSKADTANVLLFPLPIAIAAATDTVTICSAGSTQLGVAPVANVNYAWAPGIGLNNAAISNPTFSRTITGSTAQVFQYILTATNTITGCVKSDTVQVRVQPLPTVTLPANYTACSGASTTIGQAEVTTYRYRWTGTTFLNNDTLAQPTYTRSIANGAPQAVETLTLTVTDRTTGCVNTFTTELRINSAPISLAGSDVSICSGDTAAIGAPARAGEVYTWLTTDGVASTSAALTTVSRLNTTNVPRVDTLIVRTTTVATGCTSQDTVLLTVNPRPSVGNIITGSNTLCPNVDGVVYTVPLEAGTTYNWTVNGGTIVTGQGTNTLVVDWGAANLNASVIVVPVNSLGCPGDTAKLDILVKIQLEPRTPVGDTLVCSAQNTVRYTTGSITGSQYTWYWQYNNGTTLVTDSSAPGAAVVNITWPHVGLAKVWVKEVNTTSSNTCEGLSDTLNVNVYPSPDSTKTIQGPAAVCETTPSVTYTLAPTVGATYRWTVTGKIPNTGDTLLTGQGTNQITVGALVADTLVITVQETSNKGCEGKVIRDTLIINPLPVVVLGSTDSVCSGQPLQLGAAPVQNLRYRWTPATGLSNDTLANPVLTLTQTGSPAVYEYVLTVVNRLTGCENLDTLKVRVNPLPLANAGIDRAICSGDTTQLGVAAVPNGVYTWSVVAPLATGLTGGILIEDTCHCISNPRVTLRNSTNQPIVQAFSMVVQDTLTGCLNYDTVLVRVNPLPIAVAFSADTVNICSGVATQLGVPATDSIRYQWTTIPISVPTGLNSDTLANPVLTLTQTGTALVRRYVVTATNRITGCFKTDTAVAIIYPLPTMAFQELDSICANGSKELRIVTSANTRVVWSPATGLNRADSSVVTVSLPNTGTTPLFQIYTLTATDTVTGCVFVDTLTVKVNPLPRAFAGADNVVCTKSVITLGEAAQAGSTYVWAAGNGLVGANTTVANPTFQVLNPSATAVTYTYTLTVTSPSGCISRDTVAITVNPQPSTVLSNLTLCSGQPGTISSLVAVTGRTYQWIVGDSLSSTTDPAAGVRRTITGTAAQQFTYTLVTTITATGCRDTASMVLTVNPLPVAAAGRNYVLCSEDTITVGAGAPVAGTTYAWATRGALPGGITVAIVNATAAQPRVTVVNTTGAAVYVPLSLNTSITATGCTNSDTTGILVHPLPVPVAGTQPVFTFCSGQSAQLGAAPVAGLSYSWTPATGLNNANIANPVVTLSQGGTTSSQTRYVLRVTNTTTGCDDTASVLVVVNPLPIVSRLPVANTCSDAPVVIGAPATLGFSYAWKPALNLSATNVAQPTFRAINPGTTALNFDYTLVVTNTATGCVDSAVYTVQLNPLPTVLPGAPVATCSRVPVQIGAAPVVGLRYSWSPSVGLDDPAFANPTVTLRNTTGADISQVYTLTVTNTTTGCVNTGSVTVTIQPEPVTVRGAYDSLLCNTNLDNRSYSVTTLPSSTLQWFVTGGTLLNVQPGVTTTITTAQVSWDSTASFYELRAVERSVNGCSAVDTVKFRLYYNNYRLVHLSTTRANDPADTAVYLSYKVTSVGNATPTAQVQVFRRIQGATAWTLVGTSSATDSVYVDRPAFAYQLVYEYYMSITDQCGNVRVSLPAQTTLRLIGEGVAASGTSRLTWNPYEGWAEGVLRYDIYRRLNDDQYEANPYASVAGSANTWTANNGQDAFTQSYRIVAVRRGTNITAMSNEVVLEFQNILQGYNVITPNGDGRNDELVFENLKLYGDGELTIFTRSGVQVYSSSSYQNNWRAEDVPAGTYYYMLKVGGARARTLKGFVEVVK